MSDPVKAPQPAVSEKTRLDHLPNRIDVGEQLVGSDEWFTVGVPSVADGSSVGGVGISSLVPIEAHRSPDKLDAPRPPATSNRSAHDPVRDDVPAEAESSGFHTELMPVPMGLQFRPVPLQVNFSPQRVGEHVAVLRFKSTWNDGVELSHDTLLHGRARHQQDVPIERARELDRASDHEAPPPAAKIGADRPLLVSQFTHATSAMNAAAELIGHQRIGLDAIARAEIASYRRAPPESPWWAQLAEFALMMGVTGIAGMLSKTVASKLTGQLEKTGLDKKLSESIAAGASDTAKEALKTIGKGAVQRLGATPKVKSKEQSTNATIEFFRRQESGLIALEHEVRAVVPFIVSALTPYEDAHRGVTNEALAALENSFVALGEVAESEQATATEIQWVAGIAQATGLTETLPGGVIATVNYSPSGHSDGVLDVDVTTTVSAENRTDVAPSAVRATGARITGISQEVADRLWDTSLATQPVPVSLRVKGPDYTTDIRRDEAGRALPGVLQKGTFSGGPSLSERTAHEIATLTLERPLSTWGIKKVDTDDATGRGDP